MIHIVRWNPGSNSTEHATLEQLPPTAAELPDSSVVWIDLDDPTPDEEDRVLKLFRRFVPMTLFCPAVIWYV